MYFLSLKYCTYQYWCLRKFWMTNVESTAEHGALTVSSSLRGSRHLLLSTYLSLFLVCLHLCSPSVSPLLLSSSQSWNSTEKLMGSSLYVHGPMVVGILRLYGHTSFSERHGVLHELKGFFRSLNRKCSICLWCLT